LASKVAVLQETRLSYECAKECVSLSSTGKHWFHRDSQSATTGIRERLSHIYDRPLPNSGLTNDAAKI